MNITSLGIALLILSIVVLANSVLIIYGLYKLHSLNESKEFFDKQHKNHSDQISKILEVVQYLINKTNSLSTQLRELDFKENLDLD